MEINKLIHRYAPERTTKKHRSSHPNYVYNGNFTLRTDVKFLPDLTLKMAFLNDYFYNRKDVYYIRFDYPTNDAGELYKRLCKLFRRINNARWKRESVSGFRLCNAVQISQHWRLFCNVATTGSRFSACLFDDLASLIRSPRSVYVSFKKPRKSLLERRYKINYTMFFERSHIPSDQIRIHMIEDYYWRIDYNDIPFLVQILFDTYGNDIETIYTDNCAGVQISTSPNIDPEDYLSTDRHRLDTRIRFFQPFGKFFNLIKTYNNHE